MALEEKYKNDKFIRRWSLIGGYPVCEFDGLEIETTDKKMIESVILQNKIVNDRLEEIEEYERLSLISEEKNGKEEYEKAKEALKQFSEETIKNVKKRRGEIEVASEMFALVDKTNKVVEVVYADCDYMPEPPRGFQKIAITVKTAPLVGWKYNPKKKEFIKT